MFEFFQNTLCVQSNWLFSEANIINYENYKKLVKRGWFKLLRKGGNGRLALVEYESMRPDIKEQIKKLVGDPYEQAKHQKFIDRILFDQAAIDFYNKHRLDNGETLQEPYKKKYLLEASILKAIDTTIQASKFKITKRKKENQWEKISEIVNTLPSHIYPHNLPKNPRRLQEKYEKFMADGYVSLIHSNFCNSNSEKLTEASKLC